MPLFPRLSLTPYAGPLEAPGGTPWGPAVSSTEPRSPGQRLCRGREHSPARSRRRPQQVRGVERAPVSSSSAHGQEMSAPKSPKGNAKQGPSGVIRVPFQGGGSLATFSFWVFPRFLGSSTSGGRCNPVANPPAGRCGSPCAENVFALARERGRTARTSQDTCPFAQQTLPQAASPATGKPRAPACMPGARGRLVLKSGLISEKPP